MSTEQEEKWATDEISLAAFVALKSDSEPSIEWSGTGCSFVFRKADIPMEHVLAFVSGEATIEPRAYHMKFSALRKAMFDTRP